MEQIKVITKKDIVALEKRTDAISQEASFKITSQEKLKQANEMLGKLKIAKNFIKEKKDSIMKPFGVTFFIPSRPQSLFQLLETRRTMKNRKTTSRVQSR